VEFWRAWRGDGAGRCLALSRAARLSCGRFSICDVIEDWRRCLYHRDFSHSLYCGSGSRINVQSTVPAFLLFRFSYLGQVEGRVDGRVWIDGAGVVGVPYRCIVGRGRRVGGGADGFWFWFWGAGFGHHGGWRLELRGMNMG
jgi:hypothetical protein